MSHYSGQNTHLKTSVIHYGLPVEEPIKVEAVKVEEIEEYDQMQRKAPAKTWSLCKWFCVVLAVLLAFFLSTVLIAGMYGYLWSCRQVKRVTADQSMQLHLPIHEIPEEDLEVIKYKSKLFYDLIEAGEVPEEDLSITAGEINGFIAHSDFLRGNAYVTISEDDKFTLDMSIPTTGLPGGKDRYFVSTMSLDIAASEEVPAGGALVTSRLRTPYPIDGIDEPLFDVKFLLYRLSSEGADDHNLVATIQSVKFLDFAVPEDDIGTKENLLECGDDDADKDCVNFMKFLNGIQSISIKDGVIAVHARRSGTEAPKSLSAEQVTSTVNGGVRTLRRLSKFFF